MQNNVNTSVERIIAKIDNDFNPDNSDWIPRVPAWVIDAMSQVDALRTYRKKVEVIVKDRIAYSPCPINDPNLVITDKNGCKIVKATSDNICCGSSSTGKQIEAKPITPNTASYINNFDAVYAPDEVIAEHVNTKDYPSRYNIKEVNYGKGQSRNYVLLNNNMIELSFDTNKIYIETDFIETAYSEAYGCDVPVVPNNGILIEAITNYCMYKMLARGYRHPVFNLGASQYGTNPYYMWNTSKDEAARSVIIKAQGTNIDDGGAWRSAFYIATFNPRG